jgi:hypothetical protein
VEPGALLQRPEPFALRQELSTKIAGITLASVPSVAPTRTGWAITPADLSTRDLLMDKENTETIFRIFKATAIKQPETWYNYAVPGVPSTIHQLIGDTLTNTAELVSEEVWAQAKQRPISCRPSRHGASPLTGKITWIVSFLAPVRPFQLFNASELSKTIDKKTAITRHDPGCQGFCNPTKCTRYARCNNCSTRADQHTRPTGPNCTEKARCANCHGPFPAGHEHCPAAPKRRHGKIIKPTKRELDSIRRQGDRSFWDTHTQATTDPAPEPQPQPQSQAPGLATNVALNQPKRKRGSVITAYENASTPASTPASTDTPASHASINSRPRRSTASRRSLNLDDLSAQSLSQENDPLAHSEEDMDLDTITVIC